MEYTKHEKTEAMDNKLWNYDQNDTSGRNDLLKNYENFNSISVGLKEYLVRHGMTEGADTDQTLSYLNELYDKKRIPFDKVTIGNWLKKNEQLTRQISKRKVMHSLCFALGLNERESEEFITKVFFERPFNFRNAYETICYYCLKDGLSWNDAVECSVWFEKQSGLASDDYGETRIIREEIAGTSSLDELKEYLKTYSDRFSGNQKTARSTAESLLIKAYGYTNNTTPAKKLTVFDVNTNAIIKDMFDFDTTTVTKGQSFKKNAAFVNYVKAYFPSNETISKFRNGEKISDDLLRKMIILLHFYCYSKECGDDADYDEYTDDIGSILYSSGFGILYPRNPYDWIFLHCMASGEPLKELQSIYKELYVDIIDQMADYDEK